MKDFNESFEATICAQRNSLPVSADQKNLNENKAVKDNIEMKIDEWNTKNMTEKEDEEMFLAKKRNRYDEEKKAN